MICWGERNCCVFVDRDAKDKCDCLQDYCIRDYEPEERITVKESNLDDVLDNLVFDHDNNMLELKRLMQLRSIARNEKFRIETEQMCERIAQRLTELNFDVELVEVKTESTKPGHWMIFADYFATPAKNVVLIYGNVGVLPVSKSDGWKYDPFSLTEKDGKLYGRGLSSTKGPLIAWIQAIDAWMKRTKDLPVNIRFIIDSDVRADVRVLRKVLDDRKDFFIGVDLLLDTTNKWIAENKPMLTISHSGYIYFDLSVKKKTDAERDRDSKLEGKQPSQTEATHPQPMEPMTELCMLMSSLMSAGECNVPGLQRHVLPLTNHDWDILSTAEEGIMEFKEKYGLTRIPHEKSAAEFLKYRWCMPGLTMHGVIMNQRLSLRDFSPLTQASSMFSVKLVCDQSIEYTSYRIRDHLDMVYRRLGCTNPMYLRITDKLKPFNGARHDRFVVAARHAYDRIFNVLALVPDTITICLPYLNEVRRYCADNVQVVALPFCSIHMKPNQVDEHMGHKEFQQMQQLLATVLFELALVPPECKCSEIANFCLKWGKATDRDFIRTTRPMKYARSHVLYELNQLAVEKHVDEDSMPNARSLLVGDMRATLDNTY